MSFWDEKEAKRLFQQLPFYNVLIEKPKIKHLKNIDLLHNLPFYDELRILRMSNTFQEYARNYKTKTADSKDHLVQLVASKSSIKDLFSELLNRMKGFKYQITIKVLLSKYKGNGDREFAPVYFNSVTKTIINSDKYMFDKSFQ